MRVRHLGRAEYLPVWQAMREFTAGRDERSPDELWVVEHPPVFTLGAAGRREHVHAPGDIPVVASDRGGQVTYHGPGQVVVYTLIDLRRAGFYVRELVYRIEASVLQVLDAVELVGERVTGAPGVYVRRHAGGGEGPDGRFAGRAKVAALGLKVHRGAAYHGVALNVGMDLSPFARIDPCGHRGLEAVDLATLGVRISWQEAASRLVERLQAHLAPADKAPAAASAASSARTGAT